MPGLLRKLIIFATVDGLVIQSPGNGWRYNGNSESSSMKIDYKTSTTSCPAPVSDEIDRDAALESFGLVGKFVPETRHDLFESRAFSPVNSASSVSANQVSFDCRTPVRRLPLVPHLHNAAPAGGPDTGKAYICHHRCGCHPHVVTVRRAQCDRTG